MKRIMSILGAATIVAASIAMPAGAQTGSDAVDGRLDFVGVDFYVTDAGNLVAQVNPRQDWQNQMITDLFSWFFGFDISNDLVQAGVLLQTHDGQVTVNGFVSTPTDTFEFRPQIFFGPDGQWLRFVLELALTGANIPGAPSLSWAISAASMDTPTSARAVFPGSAGQFNLPVDLPTIDPRAGAIGELDDAGNWVKIANPTPAPTEAPASTAPTTTAEPTTTATTAVTTAVTESVAPASTLPAGQGGAAGGGGGQNGSNGGSRGTTAFWVFSIVVFLLMITIFLYLRGRRTRRRGLEIDSPSLHLDTPSWDLPAELGEIYTDMTDVERRQAIRDFDAAPDKPAYMKYFKALQKYHAGQGGGTPPQKPPGI